MFVDSLPICSVAFLLRIVLSRGVEQDVFFQTPHLVSEDTSTRLILVLAEAVLIRACGCCLDVVQGVNKISLC